MLRLNVPPKDTVELWNEETNQFDYTPASPGGVLELEHSLVSLSKWESITLKPFLDKEEKDQEETLLYIKCMDLSNDTPEELFLNLSNENFSDISAYIDAKMTATTFSDISDARARNTGEFITSEIIYYWMVSLNIPVEFENWHLNRLISLVKVINLKNAPEKKVRRSDSIAQRRRLNQERRAKFNSKG